MSESVERDAALAFAHFAARGGTETAMDQTVVLCRDCKNFLEYTKQYVQTVDAANGDCYIRLVSGADKQFCACKYDDFCSYGKRKDGGSDAKES